MEQRTVKNSISHPNSFVHISDEQLEAYNGASIPETPILVKARSWGGL